LRKGKRGEREREREREKETDKKTYKQRGQRELRGETSFQIDCTHKMMHVFNLRPENIPLL
jgi:hypothetical protein